MYDRLRRVVSFPCGNHFLQRALQYSGLEGIAKIRSKIDSVWCSVVILHRASLMRCVRPRASRRYYAQAAGAGAPPMRPDIAALKGAGLG